MKNIIEDIRGGMYQSQSSNKRRTAMYSVIAETADLLEIDLRIDINDKIFDNIFSQLLSCIYIPTRGELIRMDEEYTL